MYDPKTGITVILKPRNSNSASAYPEHQVPPTSDLFATNQNECFIEGKVGEHFAIEVILHPQEFNFGRNQLVRVCFAVDGAGLDPDYPQNIIRKPIGWTKDSYALLGEWDNGIVSPIHDRSGKRWFRRFAFGDETKGTAAWFLGRRDDENQYVLPVETKEQFIATRRVGGLGDGKQGVEVRLELGAELLSRGFARFVFFFATREFLETNGIVAKTKQADDAGEMKDGATKVEDGAVEAEDGGAEDGDADDGGAGAA